MARSKPNSGARRYTVGGRGLAEQHRYPSTSRPARHKPHRWRRHGSARKGVGARIAKIPAGNLRKGRASKATPPRRGKLPPMTTATRPTWRKIRKLLRLVANDGLAPTRAASLVNLPVAYLDNPRFQRLVDHAEASLQLTALRTVNTAGTKQTETVTPASGDRVRVSARAWQTKDWRAPAWLLERRFPQESGAQQPQQVASAVVDVLHALAALRDQPAQLAVHKPLALADGKQEHARAREGS